MVQRSFRRSHRAPTKGTIAVLFRDDALPFPPPTPLRQEVSSARLIGKISLPSETAGTFGGLEDCLLTTIPAHCCRVSSTSLRIFRQIYYTYNSPEFREVRNAGGVRRVTSRGEPAATGITESREPSRKNWKRALACAPHSLVPFVILVTKSTRDSRYDLYFKASRSSRAHGATPFDTARGEQKFRRPLDAVSSSLTVRTNRRAVRGDSLYASFPPFLRAGANETSEAARPRTSSILRSETNTSRGDLFGRPPRIGFPATRNHGSISRLGQDFFPLESHPRSPRRHRRPGHVGGGLERRDGLDGCRDDPRS